MAIIVLLVIVSLVASDYCHATRADYVVLAVTGFLMFTLNYALLFWAELHVSSGLAAVFQASIPIFGMVFAHWMLPDEPLRWQRLLGALVAMVGVALICARLLNFNGWLAFLGGLGVTVGAATAAFSNVLLKAKRIQLAPSMLAAWQMIFGTVPLLLLGFVLDGNPLRFHWTGSRDCLPALSRGDWLLVYVSSSLLAPAADVSDEPANHLADHSTRGDCHRLGIWRRKAFSLVDAGCGFRLGRRLDDFPSPR